MMSDNMCLLVYHYIFEQLTIIPKPSILGVCGCSGYTSKFYEYYSEYCTLDDNDEEYTSNLSGQDASLIWL